MRHSMILTLALAASLSLTFGASAATVKKRVHHHPAAPAAKMEDDGTILRPSNVVAPDSLPDYTINSKDGTQDGVAPFSRNQQFDHNLPTQLNNPGEPRPLFTF
jgi:hypothetical protein